MQILSRLSLHLWTLEDEEEDDDDDDEDAPVTHPSSIDWILFYLYCRGRTHKPSRLKATEIDPHSPLWYACTYATQAKAFSRQVQALHFLLFVCARCKTLVLLSALLCHITNRKYREWEGEGQ